MTDGYYGPARAAYAQILPILKTAAASSPDPAAFWSGMLIYVSGIAIEDLGEINVAMILRTIAALDTIAAGVLAHEDGTDDELRAH